jgi:hypothetical protein
LMPHVMSAEIAERSMRLFAKTVMPKFRNTGKAAAE